MRSKGKTIGLYIHVPFCKSKCYYCDFNSFAGKDELVEPYFKALTDEIRLYAGRLKDCRIKTVFIGGGTPSCVEGRYIYETLNSCWQYFNVEQDAEVSIEANPGTLTHEKLILYKAAGINRLSMGLQAWQDRLLKGVGRIHNVGDFIENYDLARKAGFDNINADLIFGLPGQTMRDWEESVINVSKIGVNHVSCYSLKVEEGTVFGDRLASGDLTPVDEDLDREMYHFAVDKLSEKGFNHYEISNFAKPGFKCRHNLIYWEAEEYVGIGAGAHSYFEGKRFNNKYGIEEYISSILSREFPAENIQTISREESMSEFMILGLRLVDGISMNEFKARFEKDVFDVFGKQISKLIKKGLIRLDGDRLKLTKIGLDLANMAFVEFV